MQATNYVRVDQNRTELIITVNITCMMVLASVYLSVSTSLASTPNIKPVEIWLLFNLAYPFLVILVNVIIQVAVLEIYCNYNFQHLLLKAIEETQREKRRPGLLKKSNKIKSESEMKKRKDSMLVLDVLKLTAKFLNPALYLFFTLAYFLYFMS